MAIRSFLICSPSPKRISSRRLPGAWQRTLAFGAHRNREAESPSRFLSLLFVSPPPAIARQTAKGLSSPALAQLPEHLRMPSTL